MWTRGAVDKVEGEGGDSGEDEESGGGGAEEAEAADGWVARKRFISGHWS